MTSKTNSSYEEKILLDIEQYIFEYIAQEYKDNNSFQNAKLSLLEAVSAQLGGFCYKSYCAEITCTTPLVSVNNKVVEHICSRLRTLPFHYSLALASLSKVIANPFDQRTSGSYYTDFRLANYVALQIENIIPADRDLKILDPASGSGILLVAAVLELNKKTKLSINKILENSVFASDLSHYAIRACLLVLSSLTNSIISIKSLKEHLRVGDSLIGKLALWEDLCPDGFDIVIGNPPWEKLKVSIHEYLLSQGHDRHYGAKVSDCHISEIDDLKINLKKYTDDLRVQYKLQDAGEMDLYKLFLELSYELIKKNNAQVLLILPAGLIRSLNTEKLRQYLFDNAKILNITLLFNRARFFAIDTRTKFLVLNAQFKLSGTKKPLKLVHADGNETRVIESSSVNIGRENLRKRSKMMLVPEVCNKTELDIFNKMIFDGISLGDCTSIYYPTFLREVDMTNDKIYFEDSAVIDSVPIIEGRMVHQFTYTAKKYVSGSGRKSIWLANSNELILSPQYWIPITSVKSSPKLRMKKQRIGFCDISGQTNERTMLASLIPSDCICGNKVPTILFENAPEHLHEDLNYFWLAVANSFCFDWMLRKMASTTINFFILKELSFPNIELASDLAKKIIEASKNLLSSCDVWKKAEIRADIDCLVLQAYKLSLEDLEVILKDFNLLDRKQPAIYGEKKSTITKDFLCLKASKIFTVEDTILLERVTEAKKQGAVPYLPTDMC